MGARPNFVKAAAILKAAKLYQDAIEITLVHTGQHLGFMSDPYFEELKLPLPVVIGIRSSRSENYFGHMIAGLMDMWSWKDGNLRPDYVMVVGDTDSTCAGAIAAVKAKIPVIHVEAGLR